jgi:hypothetical protein
MNNLKNAKIDAYRLFLLGGLFMRVNLEDLYEGPRFEKRAKSRRYNKLLNIGIALVVLLILFFTYKLIFGGNDDAASTEVTEQASMNNGEEGSAVGSNDEEEDLENTNTVTEASDETTEDANIASEETTEDTDEAAENPKQNDEIVENSDDPNVKETFINPSWKPVGTKQAEPHVATYKTESTDWQEMIKAFELATGLTEAEWTLWRIGNNGSPQDAKGVVSTKDRQYVYRIYIEWVENEGWKPTKLEHLNEVPKEYTGASNHTEATTDDEEASEG